MKELHVLGDFIPQRPSTGVCPWTPLRSRDPRFWISRYKYLVTIRRALLVSKCLHQFNDIYQHNGSEESEIVADGHCG